MGIKDPNAYKEGKVHFLKDFLGWYDTLYPKESVKELVYWLDENDPNIIWWNEGMGHWNSSILGEDIRIINNEGSK